ncbi:MAG: hypothetical protein BGO45_03715 [Microbacterium sp. 71-36]|uniref:hypothetical protein n=1 Tax=unclassified Microbacterium TaxID=2609290 RepID=UPI0008696CAE|nr:MULTISPECIES: hypothetical protein [unclassified Microbacterium]MBN9212172.1 hypothetical protein [Microbacterium sp.]ODT43125.1 MAG: hypothetical protein ABS60_00510 [Microbacterium sp. SCN 71-17]OJV74963.1 MAG: hypothetical protein BGO45_03715 [Microbacterium sp. 71-36]
MRTTVLPLREPLGQPIVLEDAAGMIWNSVIRAGDDGIGVDDLARAIATDAECSFEEAVEVAGSLVPFLDDLTARGVLRRTDAGNGRG